MQHHPLTTTADTDTVAPYVRRPGWVTRRMMNPVIAMLARRGIGPFGAQVLAVRGRKTGEWRRTPVNPLELDGERYLVAARGHVQWTKNMRVAGGGELRAGRHTERFEAAEVADADKPAILRAYLKRWAFEVGAFFDGVGADAPHTELERIAPDHPIFRLNAAD